MSKARENLPQRLLEYTVSQDYTLYTEIDQAVWRYIMKISVPFFKKHAHKSYVEGLEMTGIPMNHIPHVDGMDKRLDEFNWGAVTVKGFIPPIIFMEFLSKKVLPIAVDIRTNEHITYTPAPDIIHEAAGHAPIIADDDYAEYLCLYGKIAHKAIQSKQDSNQYDIIRKLSDMKENPNTDPYELEKIEKEFEKISLEDHWVSEANELAKMNWWTIEYGLIGEMENPKIYGAGLLSSVGESIECLDNKIKKFPMSIDCIKQDYNITEPQPQLFVTKNFKNLKNILNEYSKTMAYKTGGKSGIEKAIKAENVTTSVYNSGLQISGIIKNYVNDKNGKIIYLNYDKNVQLSYNNTEIDGHGTSYHSEGYGAAIGILSEVSLPIHKLSKNELFTLGIEKGSQTKLTFLGGLIISGLIINILKLDGRPIIISMENCSVKLNDNYLFKPEWGTYDLACGNKIVSVFGGPADWSNYYNSKSDPNSLTHQSSNISSENMHLNKLYIQVKKLKKNNSPNKNYMPILDELYKYYPKEWLLCMNIYEIILGDKSLNTEIEYLRNYIKKFTKDAILKDTIKRGLQILEKN